MPYKLKDQSLPIPKNSDQHPSLDHPHTHTHNARKHLWSRRTNNKNNTKNGQTGNHTLPSICTSLHLKWGVLSICQSTGRKQVLRFFHTSWVGSHPLEFFLGGGNVWLSPPFQLTLLTNGCKTLVMSLSHIFYFTFNLLKSEVFTHLDDWTRTNVTFWQLSFDMAWRRVTFEWTKVWICQQLFITLSVVMSE